MIILNRFLKIIDLGYCKLFEKGTRLNRISYLKGNLILAFAVSLLAEGLNKLMALTDNKALHALLLVIILALIIYYCIRAFVSRLHDIGLSGWYFLAMLILYKIVSIKFTSIAMAVMVAWNLFVFIFPGKSKNNRYGITVESHSDKKEIFIA